METEARTADATGPDPETAFDEPHDTSEAQGFDIRIRREAVNPQPAGVYAYRIDMPRQLRAWKPAVFAQRLESLAIAFIMATVDGFKGRRIGLDFRLWFYALDAEGETEPDHEDYGMLWHGMPLDSAYLILSCERDDTEVEVRFDSFLEMARVVNPDSFRIPRIPRGAHPMFRYQRGKVAAYAGSILIDPAVGRVPGLFCPDIARGRVLNRWIKLDLDASVRRAAANGNGPIRPSMDITRNGEDTGTTMEVRQWHWRNPARRPRKGASGKRKGKGARKQRRGV